MRHAKPVRLKTAPTGEQGVYFFRIHYNLGSCKKQVQSSLEKPIFAVRSETREKTRFLCITS